MHTGGGKYGRVKAWRIKNNYVISQQISQVWPSENGESMVDEKYLGYLTAEFQSAPTAAVLASYTCSRSMLHVARIKLH